MVCLMSNIKLMVFASTQLADDVRRMHCNACAQSAASMHMNNACYAATLYELGIGGVYSPLQRRSSICTSLCDLDP